MLPRELSPPGVRLRAWTLNKEAMNQLISLCCALTMTSPAWAQVRFTGSVVAEDGAPIAGANLVLGDDRSFGGVTGADGTFTIGGLQVGEQRVRISYIGFEGIDTLVTVAQGSSHRFTLRSQAIEMRAAEVTALRAGDRAPFAKSTLTREAIDRMNTAVDLPFLLELQPSMVSTSDAGTGIGYTYMRIRGTDATRTNITVNGVPFNDPESQGAFLVNMPDLATSAEDIEVQRGVGTSTNGPAAFGASVNVRTTAVRREPWALVSAGGGSYNTQRYSVAAGTGLVQDRFSFDVRLSSITSDGYIDRASADLKSYFLQGAWLGRNRSVRLVSFRGKEVTYQAWGGVPKEIIDTARTYNGYTYENEVDNYDQTHYQLLFDQRLGANATVNLTLYRVLGAGYFEQYREGDELSTYGIDPAVINGDTVTTSDIIRRRWLDNVLNGANLSGEFTLGTHRLVVGASANEYRGAHFGELIWARYAGNADIRDRYYDNAARKTDANAYAKLTYAAGPRVDVYGDLQVRRVQHDFLGFNDAVESTMQQAAFTFVNPKAGVLWRVREGGKAYGSFAVANREPNREDLQQTTPASRPRAERLHDFEFGYEQRAARYSAGVNFYFMDYRDQLVLTGELNDVGAALRTNVPSSQRAGVELMFAAQLAKRILWKGNATFSRNRVGSFVEYVDAYDADFNWVGQRALEQRGTDLAFSPEVVAGSELSWRFWSKPGRCNADLSLLTKYVGDQYLDNTSSPDRMLDAYLVNDVRLHVDLTRVRGVRSVAFNLTVRNIGNTLYESNGWVYSYFVDGARTQDIGLYPQAPLNLLGGVTFRF